MPYGVCKKCGCTDTNPCHNPFHGNCWWVDESHELCCHCADPKIANDLNTHHCVNSNDKYLQSVAEVLVCKNCKHWHKDKDSDDVKDENAWGDCDIIECGSYGSDPMCIEFEEKEEKGMITYYLTLSETFPKGHRREGEETNKKNNKS